MIIIILLLLASMGAYIIEIWLNTNTFVEYMCLARLSKWFAINDYVTIRKDHFNGGYVEFLQEYIDCFFIRLISCPTCLSFWLAIICVGLWSIVSLSIWPLLFVFPLAFLNLFLYRLLNKLV